MASDMTSTYLLYLATARKWDTPCPRFENAAKELLRRGWIRRRWVFFGPVTMTVAGAKALSARLCPDR